MLFSGLAVLMPLRIMVLILLVLCCLTRDGLGFSSTNFF